MTVVKSVRFDEALVEKIDKLCKAQNRTFSNMCETVLMEAVLGLKGAKQFGVWDNHSSTWFEPVYEFKNGPDKLPDIISVIMGPDGYFILYKHRGDLWSIDNQDPKRFELKMR